MSPEYLRKLADIADPDETWRTADPLDYLRLSEEKRQQHDTGVALRRYAEHLERVKRAMEEKRSVLITPLSESGCAVRLADTPEDHARLRDKRADMQPRKPGVEMAIDDEVLEALGKRERMMTYVVANCMRMYHKKHNGTLETSSVLRSLKRMEKAGKVRRVKSVYARQICWQAVKQPPKGGD